MDIKSRRKKVAQLGRALGDQSLTDTAKRIGVSQVTLYQHIRRGITDIRKIRRYAQGLKITFFEAVELMSIPEYAPATISTNKQAIDLTKHVSPAAIHKGAKALRELIGDNDLTKHKEIKQLILKHVCNIYQSDL